MVEIKGHICIPNDNIVSSHLAMDIDIEYTMTKYPGDDPAQDSNKVDWIHGTKAMQQLLQRMMDNESHSEYRHIILDFSHGRTHLSVVRLNKDSTTCGFTPLHSHRLTDHHPVSTILIVLRSDLITWTTPQ